MASPPWTILWIRRSFRLQDNPLLESALQCAEGPILPLFIWPQGKDYPSNYHWKPGRATQWWLHHSLKAFQEQLANRHSQLLLRIGDPLAVLTELVDTYPIGRILYDERFEPYERSLDEKIKATMGARFIETHGIQTNLLIHPRVPTTQQGGPFKVYTPFWKHLSARGLQFPTPPNLALPIPAPDTWPTSVPLEELGLLPKIPWDQSFYHCWTPGELGAQRQLHVFVEEAITHYKDRRDMPGVSGTSKLSPHLHFGEISPQQILRTLQHLLPSPFSPGPETYVKELAWREFAHHLLYHFPETTDKPLRPEFENFPWESNSHWQKVWEEGKTGYPIVDAGMRELWTTGWMHNRVRMIAASFLVKDLMLPWQIGARWFWDTLVDADLANNTLGWQWSAGCGADAAPYFRIFNPVMQSQKFDPQGVYLQRWIPELKSLSGPLCHQPWEAPPLLRPSPYPLPIVDHHEARNKALAALKTISKSKAPA